MLENGRMRLLTDEEQDACMPTVEQLEAYLAEPDDAVAAALSDKDKRLVAKFILCGRNIADAEHAKVIKAVAEWVKTNGRGWDTGGTSVFVIDKAKWQDFIDNREGHWPVDA